MSEVRVAEGKVRIIYGSHATPVDPAAVRLTAGRVGAVVLETGDDAWSQDPAKSLRRYREQDRQYAGLFPWLERDGIPVYFLEASTRFPCADIGLMAVETAVGIKLLRDVGRDVEDRRIARESRRRLLGEDKAEPLSRRDWLGACAKAALGTWLQSPLVSTLGRGAGQAVAVLDDPTSRLRRLAVAAHPEAEWTHRFRNAVLAYKLRGVLAAGQARELAVILGATHTPIEDDLRAPLPALLGKIRALRRVVEVTAADTVSGVCRLEFRGGRWQSVQSYDFPDLIPLSEVA